jgi:hypothetical protein
MGRGEPMIIWKLGLEIKEKKTSEVKNEKCH